MAEVPVDKSKFDLKYFFTGDGLKDWFKAWGSGVRLLVTIIIISILILGAVKIWRFFFPKPSSNVNKPSCIVLPGAKVDKIDQTSTQVMVTEKSNEVGAGVAAVEYDNKTGGAVGVWYKHKF